MNRIERDLQAMGIVLESAKPAAGNYLGCKQVGNLLFVSGRVSDLKGQVGKDISLEEAIIAARNTVVLILSIVKQDLKDLDCIEGVVKLQGFVRSADNFTQHPAVLDGASDLLIKLFGENGRHARTATGVNQLPFGAALQLDLILQLRSVKE